MARCNKLTPLPFKGLSTQYPLLCEVFMLVHDTLLQCCMLHVYIFRDFRFARG